MKQATISRRDRALRALRKSNVQGENIALIPASELHALDKWQKRAQLLPSGDTLLVVPRNNPRLQEVVRRIGQSLRAQGRPLTIISTCRSSLGQVE